MNKAEIIANYGEAAWQKVLEQGRARYNTNREKVLAQQREYIKAHKEEAKEYQKKYREEHREERNAADKRYYKEHREEIKETGKEYREEHKEEVKARNREISRIGGKHYDKHLAYSKTGIPGEKHKIRDKHGNQYRPYKQIIAPDSEIHHEWVPETADYRGVALVEADPHRYGIIDVIEILDGKITLLSEEQIRSGGA